MADTVMSRIDFYLLASAGAASRQVFACRLAEKAWRMQNTVHIQASDTEHARQLDDLLWTFRDGSFVPHERIAPQAENAEAPVTIGSPGEIRPADLLINLADELPLEPDAFQRVAEIVTSDDDCRRRGRQRYADYRAQGHDLQVHEL